MRIWLQNRSRKGVCKPELLFRAGFWPGGQSGGRAAPGRGIENVLFKDITYNGDRANLSIIEGYNEERTIRNIRFENLRINGELITDAMPGKPRWYQTGDMARIYVGPHVEGVEFVETKE